MSTQQPEQNGNYLQNPEPVNLAAKLRALMAENQLQKQSQKSNFDGTFQPINAQNTQTQFQNQFSQEVQQDYNQNRKSSSYSPDQTQNQIFQNNFSQPEFLPNLSNFTSNQSFPNPYNLPPLPKVGEINSEIIPQFNPPEITGSLDLTTPNLQKILDQPKQNLELKNPTPTSSQTPISTQQISAGQKNEIRHFRRKMPRMPSLTETNATYKLQNFLNLKIEN